MVTTGGYPARRHKSTTPRPPRGKLKENPGQSLSGKSAEGGKRRDEPGKENLELKNCIALVVI